MKDKVQVAIDTLTVKIESEKSRSLLLDKFHEIQKFCKDIETEMSNLGESDAGGSILKKIKKLEVCVKKKNQVYLDHPSISNIPLKSVGALVLSVCYCA